MKRILIILTVYLFNLTACATFPPPEISNGRYINHKYAFDIEIPEGWYQTEKIPVWIKDILDEEKRSTIRIMFFNNDTNGLICVTSYKTIWSFDLISYAYEGVKKNLQKILEKKEKKFSKDHYVKNYSYKIYSIENWTEELSYETEFNKIEMMSNYIMYGCDSDDTCIAGIELITDIKTFDENLDVFNKVINSFQKREIVEFKFLR
ncbi:MAG: hypothetical protein ISS67_02030 [Desulfobacterales bacterium]|uniref:Lipoprotein n=1 Tax=Candidatus Desulfaltia bathyphila TaxID=2841697 RepID=A0A8J6T8E3_9BACT|nr:hypothetical protein [Candidatus Desulfaltia bathyphila]MBL7195900.1 hypothetical protein [Desulfobacterales bacterium]MBL7207290.1 hypothetical protein [Desulfobacterales bacterium]